MFKRTLLIAWLASIAFMVVAVLSGGGVRSVEAHPGHTACLGAPAAAEEGALPVGPSPAFGHVAAFLATSLGGLHDLAADLHTVICEPKE